MSFISQFMQNMQDPNNSTARGLNLLMNSMTPTFNPNQNAFSGLGLLGGQQNNQGMQNGMLNNFVSGQTRPFLQGQQYNPQAPQMPINPTQFAPNPGVQGSDSVGNNGYLNQVRQQIESAFPDNKVMQQVALSQAMLESGFNPSNPNPSSLASLNNNLFGIKGSGTAGSANMQTNEFQNGAMTPQNAQFAANNNMSDSINQYKNLLNSSRYQGVMNAKTPGEAFNALQNSGYATDPNYAAKLQKIHQLYVAPLFNT